MSEEKTNEPTPEEIEREDQIAREHHRSHQLWLERRVQLFGELAATLAAHTKDAENDHDVSLAQVNKARVLSALEDLLLPPKDDRSPIARFFDNLADSDVLPGLIEQLAKMGIPDFKPGVPSVEETPAAPVAIINLSDEELAEDMAEAARWYKEVLDEQARRSKPASMPFVDATRAVSDEQLAVMASVIAAERERRAAPPPGP